MFNLNPRALLSPSVERRALGNPETKCLLIGFHEEQSKRGVFMLERRVSRHRKVETPNFLAIRTLRRMFFYIVFPRALGRSYVLVIRMKDAMLKK